MSRVGWWVSLAAAVLWGCAVLVTNTAGVSLPAYILYFYGGLFFGAITAVGGAILLARGLKRRERATRIFPAPFIAQVALLVIVFVGVSLGAGSDVRFAASRSAMEKVALGVRRGVVPRTPVTIGAYEVSRIDTAGPAVRFIIGEVGLDSAGLVYSPGGKPLAVGEDYYEHIDGPWWGWRESW